MGVILGGCHEQGRNYLDTDEATFAAALDHTVLGDVRREYVMRPVLCLKSDAMSIAQAILGAAVGTLVVHVGCGSPISCGTGWILDGQIDGDSVSPSLQKLRLRYTRITPGIWGFQLPTGLAVTCTSGTTDLVWNGTTVESWKTGVTCEAIPMRFTGRKLDQGTYLVFLFVNGVQVETWRIPTGEAELDPVNVADHRMTWETEGNTVRLKLLNTILKEYTA